MKKALLALMLLCLLAAMVNTDGVYAALPVPGPGPILPGPVLPPIDLIDTVAAANLKTISTIPLYRLRIYVLADGKLALFYGYTISEGERASMKTKGWIDDGIVTYVSPVWMPDLVPLYRWVKGGINYCLSIKPEEDLDSAGFKVTAYLGYVKAPLPPADIPVGEQLVRSWVAFNHDWTFTPYYSSQASWTRPSEFRSTMFDKAEGYRVFRAWPAAKELQKMAVTPFSTALTGGNKATIRWTSAAPSGYVSLLFSQDDGANWVPIASNVQNGLGQNEWTIPNVSKNACRIMVRWSSKSNYPASAWAISPKFAINASANPVWSIVLPPLFQLVSLAPEAPTNLLTSTDADTHTITLNWTDNSTSETGFTIERRTSRSIFAALATVTANTTSHADATALAGVTYTYRVRANGSALNSDYSNESQGVYYTAATPPPPPATIAPPSNLQAVKLGGGTRMVQLIWTKSSETLAQSYLIERKTTGDWSAYASTSADVSVYVDASLTDPAVDEYVYRVKVMTAGGQSGPTNEASVSFAASQPPQPPGGPTYDGTQSSWAEPEITLAYQTGLSYPGVMYEFQRKITREEFCTIAVKLYEKLSGQTATAGEDPFDDTNNPDILKAYALGIVRGVSAVLFAPANNITRQEMCVMIYRALQAAGENTLLVPGGEFPFGDLGEIASWALNEVRFCYQKQIMKGTSPTTISPLVNTPREQAIVLIFRTHQAFK